ncbi:MAG: histone acetyltransferase [Caulobacteraceae bacterium]|nr:histone acetyltransferase [Caulobacteraceae bacterium]
MIQPLIRRAAHADAQILVDIGRLTFVQTFGHLYPPADLAAFLETAHSPARWAAGLADPDMAVWLAADAGQAVGYAKAGPCGLPHPDVTSACGELKTLYLLQSHQNDGLGGRLFAAALAWLEAAGPRDLWLGVWSENHGAQRFYARHGFEPAGEYGFVVGGTVDREFILRRAARSFSES